MGGRMPLPGPCPGPAQRGRPRGDAERGPRGDGRRCAGHCRAQESPGMRWGAQGGLAALLSYPRSWSRDRSADRSPGCSTAGPFPSLPLRVRLQPGELQEAASATAGLTAGAAASGNGRRRFRNLREFSGRAGAEAMGRGGGRAGGGAAAGPRGPAPAAGGRGGRERFPQKEHPTGRK